MIGVHSGFTTLVQQKCPHVMRLHCMIHRQALASRTLPLSLKSVLDIVIATVNYVKGSALNTRLFGDLCTDMDADHHNLIYYTSIRWLSKGNLVRRVFVLREEIKSFLDIQDKVELLAHWHSPEFLLQLAYLVDSFSLLNNLNLQLQGKDAIIIDFIDKIKGFINKVGNWSRKVKLGNTDMLETVSEVLAESSCPAELCNDIVEHLNSLASNLKHYFPEITTENVQLIRNPFTAAVATIDDNDEAQTQLHCNSRMTLERDTFQCNVTFIILGKHEQFISTSL